MREPGARDPGTRDPGTRETGTTSPQADGETLRALVREVLAELLPATTDGRAGEARLAPAQPGLAHTVRENVESVETVSLRTDADLARFVLRLLHLFENPARRDALRAGRLRFRLAAASAPGSVQPSHRVEKGAVTEAMVVAASRAGARLVLGRRAVLTPLARDRARASGVEIEKER